MDMVHIFVKAFTVQLIFSSFGFLKYVNGFPSGGRNPNCLAGSHGKRNTSAFSFVPPINERNL